MSEWAQLWDPKFVIILLMLSKLKQSFVLGLIIIKVNIDLFQKGSNVPQKHSHSPYIQDCQIGIDD